MNSYSLLNSTLDSFFNDTFFSSVYSRHPAHHLVNRASNLRLAANFYEDDESYFARVQLPGVKKDELKLDLEKDLLTIRYERTTASEDDEKVSYKRALQVPDGVDADKIEAKLEDGILTLTLPKGEKAKPREITVG